MLYPLEETINRDQRITAMHQLPFVVWMTGLSGSGKSTLAVALEKSLIEKGFKAYMLDGDTIRTGLNKDLSFSESDRRENIRRIGEVCKLMNNAGLIVITSFISPFRSERDFVRSLIPPSDFAEVFVNASLDEIQDKVKQYELDLVQLHGDESPEFCQLLHQNKFKVIKNFN